VVLDGAPALEVGFGGSFDVFMLTDLLHHFSPSACVAALVEAPSAFEEEREGEEQRCGHQVREGHGRALIRRAQAAEVDERRVLDRQVPCTPSALRTMFDTDTVF
jgi:hypothetical protein